MICLYLILTLDSLFEGWAHDAVEMRQKFMTAYPDAKGVFVFIYGSKPDGKLTDYQQEMLDDYIAERNTVG